MFRKAAVQLLSAQWRPHSEQLKLWVIGSASDVTALSLARDYVNNLDVRSVLQTFEDGLELTSILPAIKYPLGTHAISNLSAHLEASASELSTKELHQLASSISLSPENLDYYDATLNTPSVAAAIRCCLRRVDHSELIAFARPFWKGSERVPQPGTRLASCVIQMTADELAFRLSTSNDKKALFDLTLRESLPLEQKEMEGLVTQLQISTKELKKAELLDLLERIASVRFAQRYAAWGTAIQRALIKKGGVGDSDCFAVFVRLIFSGTAVDDSICRQICKVSGCLGPALTAEVLNALRDSDSVLCSSSSSLEDVRASLHGHILMQLEKLQSEPPTEEYLEWVLCLSFFSQVDASSLLSRAVSSGRLATELSTKEVALVCDIMISTSVFLPSLLPAIRQSIETNGLSQRASVHALYILQRSGIKAPSALLKKAFGRAGARLVAACAAKVSGNDELSPRDRALLVAGLCFVDDEQQTVLLRRIVDSQELSLPTAIFFLRHVRHANTKSSRWVKKVAVSRVLRSASSCRTEELSIVLSALSDLGVRDATAFQHVLEEVKRQGPCTHDVIVAAKAARNLRLTSLLEQSELIESLGQIGNICSDDLLPLLSCCTVRQRQSLLLYPEVAAVLHQTSHTESTTSDLVLLFTFLPSQSAKRAEVILELQTREPVERGVLSSEDVVAAFEAAFSSQEVEGLCRVLSRAAQSCEESHLMRLLRCASKCSKVPKSFFRLVGKPIISAVNEKRFSPVSSSAWLNFYVNHEIRDDSVGRRLLSVLSNAQSQSPSPFHKDYNRGARFYGVDVRKPQKKRRHADFFSMTPQ